MDNPNTDQFVQLRMAFIRPNYGQVAANLLGLPVTSETHWGNNGPFNSACCLHHTNCIVNVVCFALSTRFGFFPN